MSTEDACESTPLVEEHEFESCKWDSKNPNLIGYSTVRCREVLTIHPAGVRCSITETDSTAMKILERKLNHRWIISPNSFYYYIWWYATVAGAILTMFVTPYQIAFEESQSFLKKMADVLEKLLVVLFTEDILVNFNLALYKDDNIILDRGQIATDYFRHLFWIDLVGVFPFASIASWIEGIHGASYESTLLTSLFKLLQFVRTRRLVKFSYKLRWDSRVSLLVYTMIRNFAAVVVNCHFQACTMYFLARLRQFDDTTWLGPHIHSMESSFETYVTAFYLCVTTFATVGYGDFSPKSVAEKSIGSLFMIFNIAIAAWIIGSITLLVLKGDEASRKYRDSLEVLHLYGTMHNFDDDLLTRLKQQLKLDFNNREISDDQVLKHFPSQVRRKLMRQLYYEHLINSNIMTGIRPQFVDAFLASCNVEIFSPGEEIVEEGSITSDLYLLVGGIAEVITNRHTSSFSEDIEFGVDPTLHSHIIRLEAGIFIGMIGFFTESSEFFSVKCMTVCKTLTLSRQSYYILAQDHPGSAGQLLQNLLQMLESFASQQYVYHPTPTLQIGRESLSAVKDLVKMHMRRRLDDDITKLLFAASRGDTKTINILCGHGFDPNKADYDSRTALMVASMKGNIDAVRLLLKHKARPNEIDMNGSTALLEATKHGHDKVQELLLASGATLCMSDSQAASVLCRAVFDGDAMLLKRLVKAGININAADYDGRTAAHIAEAEGNVAAIRVLVDSGADLTLPDRWGNAVGKNYV